MLIKSSNDPEVTIQSRFQEQKIILKGNKQNIYKTIASSMLPIRFQSADLVREKIKELSPWFSNYRFAWNHEIIEWPVCFPGIDHEFFRQREERIFPTIEQKFPKSSTILDLGCADGYFPIAAWKRGYRSITAVDCREDNIRRAKFAAKLHQAKIRWVHQDVYQYTTRKRFDLILCQGLLYHLENPIGLFEILKKTAAKGIVLSGWARYHEKPVFIFEREESGDIRNSKKKNILIPSVAVVEALLSAYEFKNVVVLRPPEAPRTPDSGQAVWLEYYFEN
jgi:SAM-dependent methyltransferase